MKLLALLLVTLSGGCVATSEVAVTKAAKQELECVQLFETMQRRSDILVGMGRGADVSRATDTTRGDIAKQLMVKVTSNTLVISTLERDTLVSENRTDATAWLPEMQVASICSGLDGETVVVGTINKRKLAATIEQDLLSLDLEAQKARHIIQQAERKPDKIRAKLRLQRDLVPKFKLAQEKLTTCRQVNGCSGDFIPNLQVIFNPKTDVQLPLKFIITTQPNVPPTSLQVIRRELEQSGLSVNTGNPKQTEESTIDVECIVPQPSSPKGSLPLIVELRCTANLKSAGEIIDTRDFYSKGAGKDYELALANASANLKEATNGDE